MKKLRIWLACLALGLALVQGAHAAITIKLATVAPRDSIWHNYLKSIDAQWREASAGQVRLKIYAGTLGDENDIVRRIRVGQLDAATITTAGLSSIDASAKALNIPLAFASNEELDYVLQTISTQWEERLVKKGFRALSWGEAGWAHLFSTHPVRTPADLKKLKLFQWSSGNSSDSEQLWRNAGFNTLSLSLVDVMPALQTGMIEAYLAPPLAALANQWFPFTPYMSDLPWAPLVGATIISTAAWDRIPERLRPEFERIAREAGIKLQRDVRKLERDAVAAMVRRGVQRVPLSAGERDQWHALAQSVYPKIRGTIVSEEYFDETLELRNQYRTGNTAAVAAAKP